MTDTADDAWSEGGHDLASRATRERGRRTLAKLRDAAVAEFSAYGYHGARVARVAKRAGTSHGTFYVYFQDKNDLLLALQNEIIAEADDLLARMPALEPGPEGWDTLHAWMDDVCTVLLDQAPIRWAVLDALIEDADPRISSRGLRAQRNWTTLLADRIRATGTTEIDPYLAAVCLINVMDNAARSVFRSHLVVSRDELVDALTELFHRTVFGTEPASAPRF
ncbi:MAG TPA: TetR/AcrR family transcriptional regulator [Acidimicrobiales bacterium]|nr:TetR/AcrR family transcriptional regulator [Acidimicrobiales bacterium]